MRIILPREEVIRMNHFDMELTQRQAKKYRKSTKKQKGKIITRYCELTGVSRNLASKRFRKVMRNIYPRVFKDESPKKKRGRKPIYTSIHKSIIRKVWELSEEICGERLYPVISEYIKQLKQNGELKYYENQYVEETINISERTLKRIIAKFAKTRKGRSNKGNSSLYKQIPIHAYFGENANKPGYVEIDYVEHNGGSSAGTFAHTGCYVGVFSGWIARFAALAKGMRGVRKIHEANEIRIYHKIHEYHPDNAKPILAVLLEKITGNKQVDFTVSRSRPYHKEDNGHVEQKNGDKVRKLVGYCRYDTKKQVKLLNRLYNLEDLISNFFLPSQKLIEKVKDEKGRVVRKKHDRAKTAYQRLLADERVSHNVKKQLMKMYNELNLVELRRESDILKDQLFRTVIA